MQTLILRLCHKHTHQSGHLSPLAHLPSSSRTTQANDFHLDRSNRLSLSPSLFSPAFLPHSHSLARDEWTVIVETSTPHCLRSSPECYRAKLKQNDIDTEAAWTRMSDIASSYARSLAITIVVGGRCPTGHPSPQ